jgi:hypothetical protein
VELGPSKAQETADTQRSSQSRSSLGVSGDGATDGCDSEATATSVSLILAEAVYREAAAAGEAFASAGLLRLLERVGRPAEADGIRRYGLDARGPTAGPTGG